MTIIPIHVIPFKYIYKPMILVHAKIMIWLHSCFGLDLNVSLSYNNTKTFYALIHLLIS
jgi:hypothetical protein